MENIYVGILQGNGCMEAVKVENAREAYKVSRTEEKPVYLYGQQINNSSMPEISGLIKKYRRR